MRICHELMRLCTRFAPLGEHVTIPIEDADTMANFRQVEGFVTVKPECLRAQESGPLGQVMTIRIENLDAVVFTIADINTGV